MNPELEPRRKDFLFITSQQCFRPFTDKTFQAFFSVSVLNQRTGRYPSTKSLHKLYKLDVFVLVLLFNLCGGRERLQTTFFLNIKGQKHNDLYDTSEVWKVWRRELTPFGFNH